MIGASGFTLFAASRMSASIESGSSSATSSRQPAAPWRSQCLTMLLSPVTMSSCHLGFCSFTSGRSLKPHQQR